MKRILAATALVFISTAAFADTDDHHFDLNASGTATPSYVGAGASLYPSTARSAHNTGGPSGDGYIYGGFGPGNDSR